MALYMLWFGSLMMSGLASEGIAEKFTKIVIKQGAGHEKECIYYDFSGLSTEYPGDPRICGLRPGAEFFR
jgi:hypothetical protein